MTTFNGNIHPFADKFAMLTAEELADLAESISEIGLLNPIVLNSDGDLIDGRNRLAACEIKGVEPVFVVNDGDPVEIVLAANVSRRHLSTGQRAMAIALGLIAAGKREGGRFAYGAVNAAIETANFGDRQNSNFREKISKAAAVADADDVLAEEVLDGETALDAAYATVTNRAEKKAAQPALVSAEAERIIAEAHAEAARILAEAKADTDGGWIGFVRDTVGETPEEAAERKARHLIEAAQMDADFKRQQYEDAINRNIVETYSEMSNALREIPSSSQQLTLLTETRAVWERAFEDGDLHGFQRLTSADFDAFEEMLPALRAAFCGD
jgi:hypothetical protein